MDRVTLMNKGAELASLILFNSYKHASRKVVASDNLLGMIVLPIPDILLVWSSLVRFHGALYCNIQCNQIRMTYKLIIRFLRITEPLSIACSPTKGSILVDRQKCFAAVAFRLSCVGYFNFMEFKTCER